MPEFLQALLLGVIEGITEFLPVSSTGHLTIVEKLLGLSVDDQGVTAFTAVIQVGAILGSIVYFRADIVRLALAWFRGLANPEARQERVYRLENKAARLPALMVLPLILFIMPCLFMVLIGPAVVTLAGGFGG